MKNLKFICIGFLLLCSSIGVADLSTTAHLNVRGESTIFKPADQLNLTLSVVTQGKEVNTALQENNQRMTQVFESLKAIQLNPNDYQTEGFTIRPVYKQIVKQDENKTHPVLDYYEVSNAIKIKTQKIELMDRLINESIKNGANQLDQVKFDINNPQAYRTEAIQLAMKNALNDAQVLAQAANVRLVRLLDVTLDQSRGPVYRSFALASTEAYDSTPIKSGNIEIHASVQATFEITPL